MVTAELAVGLPAVALLAVLCAAVVAVAATHVRCVDAARSGARELARGEDPAVVRALVAERAPEGAVIRFVHLRGDLVAVQVYDRAALWPGGPGLTVGGGAVAAVEGE